MAAPSGTQWGSTINGKTRLGLYIASSSNATQTTITCQVWFWSKYSVHDSANNFYFDHHIMGKAGVTLPVFVDEMIASLKTDD